jgi:anti-sigma regulatory factor (Ser/Thr protein kinase)
MEELHERTSRRFTGSGTAPALGREFVSDALAYWGIQDEFPDVGLVTSELVTNAVRHVGGRFTLTVALVPDRVRIEVSDTSSRRPVLHAHDPTRVGGWGLEIVQQLASNWGSEPQADGKVVWCELSKATPGDQTIGAATL